MVASFTTRTRGEGARNIELLAATTNPTEWPRGVARDEREWGDITRDHAPSADHAIVAEAHAANNGRVRADGDALLDDGRREFTTPWRVCSRREDVGKDRARSDEDVLGELDPLVNRNIVLDATPRADTHPWRDVASLTELRVSRQDDALSHVAEVPDLDATLERGVRRHDRARVDEPPLG